MKWLFLTMLLFLPGCAENRGNGKPPVSVPGGGTLNAPPSDGIKVPGK